jgi:hypothetical protein
MESNEIAAPPESIATPSLVLRWRFRGAEVNINFSRAPDFLKVVE